MGIFSWLKPKRDQVDFRAGVTSIVGAVPTPGRDAILALNTSLKEMVAENDFAIYGFESQMDMMAAFTIGEMFDAASGPVADTVFYEMIGKMFAIREERIDTLIKAVRQSRGL